MADAADAAEELERFRQEWQQEVRARARGPSGLALVDSKKPAAAKNGRLGSHLGQKTDTQGRLERNSRPIVSERSGGEQATVNGDASEGNADTTISEQPRSALEHYEKAVEREEEGNLGDSLKHYRTAYKLDDAVDKLYRRKYFPPPEPTSKVATANPSNAAASQADPAHHSLQSHQLVQIPDLIASFQQTSIIGEDPPTDASPAPPCPISLLPVELLVKIFRVTATSDSASFARLPQVCRRLAYLVTTEESIWRDLCGSRNFGFPAMKYDWALTVMGNALPMSIEQLDIGIAEMSLDSTRPQIPLSSIYPSYRESWRDRPRVRFNGCYISTVNYYRPGAAAATSVTWNAPVIIVTYYRYLRFFRDGSCISLLTTSSPSEVVHHLTRDNLHCGHANGLPSAVMNQALRGRWRLSGNPYSKTDGVESDETEEGTLDIETEGADADRPEPKYMYKMMLKMKHARKSKFSTRNNKLTWIGYWSHNKLTDDWATFDLKNDRPYLFSRVKSYLDHDDEETAL